MIRPERSVSERSDQSAHHFKELVVRETFNARTLPLNSHL